MCGISREGHQGFCKEIGISVCRTRVTVLFCYKLHVLVKQCLVQMFSVHL